MPAFQKPAAYNSYDPEEERALYHKGIQLFNEHDFFEAHETWEEVWNMASGEKARFYQGIIQIAVTLEHMCRNNPRGVKKVWRTMVSKFADLPDVYMGINITELLVELHPVIEPILNMPTAKGQLPGDVVLQWEPDKIPVLKLQYDPFETGEA